MLLSSLAGDFSLFYSHTCLIYNAFHVPYILNYSSLPSNCFRQETQDFFSISKLELYCKGINILYLFIRVEKLPEELR